MANNQRKVYFLWISKGKIRKYTFLCVQTGLILWERRGMIKDVQDVLPCTQRPKADA